MAKSAIARVRKPKPLGPNRLLMPLMTPPTLIDTGLWPPHGLPARGRHGAITVYLVGGAVRDALLQQADATSTPLQDRDWVVVGATVADMVDAGFQAVGQDFPVFLHPQTHEEYALARTERKTAAGYHGFVFHTSPEVTLEQDLVRRDLSINAIALAQNGTLVDPCGGIRDLQQGILRHASPAFSEDPVRLLRLARFAARWPHFQLAPSTAALLRQMVHNGEVQALVRERVWQELARGLQACAPPRMWKVLADCGAFTALWPQLQPHLALVLQSQQAFAALLNQWQDATGESTYHPSAFDLAQRWTQVCMPLPLQAVQSWHAHLKPPKSCVAWAELGSRIYARLLNAVAGEAAGTHLDAETCLRLLEDCDALRRPERCKAVLHVFPWVSDRADSQDFAARLRLVTQLQHALQTALQIPAADLAQQAQNQGISGPAMGQAIRAARLRALQNKILGGGWSEQEQAR